MSSSLMVVFLIVAATGVVSHGLGQDEKCVATLQAPKGSPWKAMSVSPNKVSLSKITRLVEKYRLKLEKGSAPPLDFQARVNLACKHLGDMWIALPSAAEDDSISGCWFDRLSESLFIFFGKLKKNPNQYPDSPFRVYMKNYCGRELPVDSPPKDMNRSMKRNTKNMNKKLKKILRYYRRNTR